MDLIIDLMFLVSIPVVVGVLVWTAWNQRHTGKQVQVGTGAPFVARTVTVKGYDEDAAVRLVRELEQRPHAR